MSRQKLLFSVSVKPLVTETLVSPVLSQLRLIWVVVGDPSLIKLPTSFSCVSE